MHKPNAILKFASPVDEREAQQRYRVVELRGDRVLVEFVCDLPLPPQNVFAVGDLCNA